MEAVPSAGDDPSIFTVPSSCPADNADGHKHPLPHPSTPQKRPRAKAHRLSTALSLVESLTTPPPTYETATRSASSPPSPSTRRRARTPRRAAQPASESSAAEDRDSDDPTSDSDDPLNHLLRLTGSLLSTSTSILASSTALHSSLSRLLASDAVTRPPRPGHDGARAELELRSELDAAERVEERLVELEGAAERCLGARTGGAGGGESKSGRSPRGGRERAERPRTIYATATGAGSGFLGGLEEDDEAVAEGVEATRGEVEQGPHGVAAQVRDRPCSARRTSSSAAQDLLGRLAGRGATTGAGQEQERESEAAPHAADPLPAQLAPPDNAAPSTSRAALDALVQEEGARSPPSSDLRKSALGSLSASEPHAHDDPAPSAALPRTPTPRRTTTPFQLATPSTASLARSTISPRPSSSSLTSPSPSRTSDARALSLTPFRSLFTTPRPNDTPSQASSPSTSPASHRPSHRRRSSTATSSAAAALSASLAQHRASTTTSLSSFAELDPAADGGSNARLGRAGALAGALAGAGTGSAKGALEALSASAGGAAGVPSSLVGKAEGLERARGGGTHGEGEGGPIAGASWWSWS